MNKTITPDFVLEYEAGGLTTMPWDKAVGWVAQFPYDKIVGVEWPAYAWPGGYEIHYITEDGGVLCHQCANENMALTADCDGDPQWRIIEGDLNYEEPDCYCGNCDRKIEPEYLEVEE